MIGGHRSEATVKRASGVRRAREWDETLAVDRVVLDAGDRQRRRIVLTGERGTHFLLDLAQPATLRDGDGLVLEDGAIVRVVGESEPLLELGVATPLQFIRLAWHLGNRHTDVQIKGDRLRIRRDHVLEEMVARLGASVTRVDAPFDPEVGVQHRHGHGG
jgi:urease accessory protein